jgi:hypothetical protein
LSGNHPPRRQAGQDVAPTISARTHGGGGLGTDFDCDGGIVLSGGGGGVHLSGSYEQMGEGIGRPSRRRVSEPCGGRGFL